MVKVRVAVTVRSQDWANHVESHHFQQKSTNVANDGPPSKQ